MKKIIYILFMLVILSIPVISYGVTINSPYAILIDAKSGRVIYENNAYEKAFPASTTKILTAIITLENCELDEKVKASYNAIMSVPSGGSIANIQVDEELSVEDLLKALLICSGNDAANILAEHIGGSIESFATIMNTRAKELGAKNSNFINANGLHDENHYSCAYDLAIFAKYAMDNFPKFREIVSTTKFNLPITNKYETDDRSFSNSNQLIVPSQSTGKKNYYYQYATGIKTGFTTPAKNCIVASAEKDGVSLICVILGASQDENGVSYRYTDAKALFDYGFSELVAVNVVEADSFVEKIDVKDAPKKENTVRLLTEKSLDTVVNKEDIMNEFEGVVQLNDEIVAPIEKGDILGTITYHVYDKDYTINLIAGNRVEKRSDVILNILKGIGIAVLIIIVLTVIFTIIKVKKTARIRKLNTYNTFRYNRRFR